MYGHNGNGCDTGANPRKRQARRAAMRRLSRNIHAGIIGFSVALAFSNGAYALPQNGQVKAGSASIVHTSPTQLDIHQATDKAVINWGSFSIAEPEHTNFIQPSASSVTLNRVVGNDLSTIAGTLTANGNVILVNPNGIFFSPTARVDVNGLIATTSDIGDDDFMAGRYNFMRALNPSSAVVNQGQVTVTEGGLAAFVAPWVENSGSINARLGRVAMASGEAFTLDLYGDNLIQLAVPTGDGPGPAPAYATGNALVANSGTIAANGGIVTLSVAQAKSVVDSVINMDGVIEARAVEQRGGTIVLHGGDSGVVSVAGRLDASGDGAGQTGGTVKVLGEKVGLLAGAKVDVSGEAGGGTALIGGNYKGAGPESNARLTYVAANASIDADALGKGDGGTVIVWSDETTQFLGAITARGGAGGGDGGFVETSGKQNLAFRGTVDVSAAGGANGTILLDPRDIFIVNPGVTEFPDTESNIIAFTDGGGTDFVFWDSQIEGLDGNVILEATRDIYVNDPLNLTLLGSGESFILQAGENININAAITTAGADIHLEAHSPHSTVVSPDPTPQLNVFGSLNSNGGNITLLGTGVQLGEVTVNSGSGNIAFTLSSGGAITIDGGSSGIPQLISTGDIILGEAFTAGRPVAGGQTAQDPIRLLASSFTYTGALDTTGDAFGAIRIYSAGTFTMNGTLTMGQDLFITADADGNGVGSVVFESGGFSTGGNVTINGGTGVSLINGAIVAGGFVNIQSSNDITALTGGDNVAEIQANGDVTLASRFVGDGLDQLQISGDGSADSVLNVTGKNSDKGGGLVNLGVITDQFATVNLTLEVANVNVDIALPGGDVIDINGAAGLSTVADVVSGNSIFDLNYTLTDAAGSISLNTPTLLSFGDVTIISQNDITVAVAIEKDGLAGDDVFPGLWLYAGNNIVVDAAIRSVNVGLNDAAIREFSVYMEADNDIVINDRIFPGNFVQGGDVTAFALNDIVINNGGAIDPNDGFINDGVVAGSIDLFAGGSLLNHGIIATGDGVISAGAAGSTTNSATGHILANAAGGILLYGATVANAGLIEVNDFGELVNGTLWIGANGDIVNTGTVDLSGTIGSAYLLADLDEFFINPGDGTGTVVNNGTILMGEGQLVLHAGQDIGSAATPFTFESALDWAVLSAQSTAGGVYVETSLADRLIIGPVVPEDLLPPDPGCPCVVPPPKFFLPFGEGIQGVTAAGEIQLANLIGAIELDHDVQGGADVTLDAAGDILFGPTVFGTGKIGSNGGTVNIIAGGSVLITDGKVDTVGSVSITAGTSITTPDGDNNDPEVIAGGDVTLTAQVIGHSESMLEIDRSGPGTGVLEVNLTASGDASNSYVDLLTDSFTELRVSLAEAQDSLEIWFSGEGSWALVDINGITGTPNESHIVSVDPGWGVDSAFTYELLDPDGIVVVDTGTIIASGDVSLTAPGDFVIGSGPGIAIDATGGAYLIRLESTAGAILSGGGIVDMGGSGDLLLLASTGIGTAIEPILTGGSYTLAASTTDGGVFVESTNFDGITVGTVDGTIGLATGGDIQITSLAGDGGGNLTIAQPINAGGNVDLIADGQIDGFAGITSGDSVALDAGWYVSFAGPIITGGDTGRVTVDAGAWVELGTIDTTGVNAGSPVLGSGNVSITSGDTVSMFGDVATGGTGDVTIESGWDIQLSNVASAGSQTYINLISEGSGDTILFGASYTTAGNNFTVNGPALVAADTSPTVDVSGGDNTAQIVFNGTLGTFFGEGSTPANLTLIIGENGHITLGDTVSGLGTLTLTRLGAAVGLSQTAPAIGDEDTAIALNLDTGSADSVEITGVPEGATLGEGSVTPPENSDVDFVLTVAGTDTGISYITLPASQPTFEILGDVDTGVATLVNNLGASELLDVPVTVLSVADLPTVSGVDTGGTAGTPIPLDLAAALTDTDGSETLSIVLSGLPGGAVLSAGTNNGDGSYTLTAADLDGLTLTAPPATAGTFNLTVAAISTEGAADNPGKDVTSASDDFSLSVTPILPITGGTLPPLFVPSTLPTDAVLFGRPARFRDVTPSTVRLNTTSELAELSPPSSGEESEQAATESGFSEACPDVALASMSWQNTPADASFNVDPSQLPYSVNVYCGGYKLSDAGRGAYGEYETLTFVTRDFWTDFKQSIQPRPVDELLAILGLLPKGKIPPSAR